MEFGPFTSSQPSSSVKRPRQPETIDLRSPGYPRSTKKQRHEERKRKIFSIQHTIQRLLYTILRHIIYKMDFINHLFLYFLSDPGGHYERVEFFAPRETPHAPNNPPTPFLKKTRQA